VATHRAMPSRPRRSRRGRGRPHRSPPPRPRSRRRRRRPRRPPRRLRARLANGAVRVPPRRRPQSGRTHASPRKPSFSRYLSLASSSSDCPGPPIPVMGSQVRATGEVYAVTVADYAEIVAALRAVPGVAEADVEPDDEGGGLGLLRLGLSPGVDEVQVATKVGRLLRERFGL